MLKQIVKVFWPYKHKDNKDRTSSAVIQDERRESTENLSEVPRLNEFFSAALETDKNNKYMNLAGYQ